MNAIGELVEVPSQEAVSIRVEPAIEARNRLTVAFRIVLAIPHLLLVGAPIGPFLAWRWTSETGVGYDWGAGGGVLGAVAAVSALISWFAIVFTGRAPEGLWKLGEFYLRWRVRAVAYTALLRDEYPPFGEESYPAEIHISPPAAERDRLRVAVRILLAVPHLVVVWLLGIAWAVVSVVAWLAILITGRYPQGLYEFAVGVLRWSTRLEAYLLLLTDEYPPFSLGENGRAQVHPRPAVEALP